MHLNKSNIQRFRDLIGETNLRFGNSELSRDLTTDFNELFFQLNHEIPSNSKFYDNKLVKAILVAQFNDLANFNLDYLIEGVNIEDYDTIRKRLKEYLVTPMPHRGLPKIAKQKKFYKFNEIRVDTPSFFWISYKNSFLIIPDFLFRKSMDNLLEIKQTSEISRDNEFHKGYRHGHYSTEYILHPV